MERQAREFELLKPYLVERWTRAAAKARRRRASRGRRRRPNDRARRSPSRILIPVANPLTAEELVRIGAALLDRGPAS